VIEGSSGEAREFGRGMAALLLWLGDMLSNGRASGGGCDPGTWPIGLGIGRGRETRGVPPLLVEVSLLSVGMPRGMSFISFVSEPPDVEAAAS
jgi:hypothetical protein